MSKNVNKTVKFKLSDMLELALKRLQAGKRSRTKKEYSCDAIADAARKFGKTQGVCGRDQRYVHNFSLFVGVKWNTFVRDCMGTPLYGLHLFDEFYSDDCATRKSQYARALFLTFGIMLLKENPEYNNCTYTHFE